MDPLGNRSERPPRRAGELRDLLIIALSLALLFALAIATGITQEVHTRISRILGGAIDEVFSLVTLLSAGLILFALRRWPRTRREGRERASTHARFQALVEQIPAIFYTWDPSGPTGTVPMPYVSPQIETILGYTQEEWTRNPRFWITRLHPDDRDGVVTASNLSDSTGAPFALEYRLLAKDDHEVWIRDESTVVASSPDGRPALVQGVMFDVTGSKRAEEKLLEAELKYRMLIEQLPVITYTESTASSNDLIYVSPQIETILGYTQEEWMADPQLWVRNLHPDDRDRVLEADRLSSENEEPFVADYRCFSRDGREVWMHNEARLIRDENGEPRFWQGLVLDITERKLAEQRLAEAEAKYRALVEQVPAVVYADAVDDVSTALYISPQYEQLLGYTVQERLAQPDLWVRTLHPDDRERVVAESIRTNETAEPFRMEYRLIAKDGRTVWVRDEGFLVRNDAGEPFVWQGVLLDISERKLAEETLRRRDAILEAVGFAAERFLKDADWRDTLPTVFRRLGEAADASRVYLFENEQTQDGFLAHTLREEWLSPGVPSIDDETNRRFPYRRGFSRWEETLSAGDAIHGLTKDFPESERLPLEREGVVSTAIVPVFVGDEWWGFLGFDECEIDRLWPQAEIDALRAAADTLGAAIGRERAYRRIRETQTQYRTLVETIPAVTYIHSPTEDGELYYISPQVEQMLGYSREEWGSTFGTWHRTLHPDDRERVLAEDARTDQTGEPFSIEYRQIAKDGRVVWVRDEAVLVRDENGEPRFWQGVRFDITARREAEVQVREAEARFRTLVEAVPAITYIDALDERATSLYISPQVREMLGYTQEEWRADPATWIDAVHPDERERVLASVRHHIGGSPFTEEYRMRTKDGRWRWISDQALVLRDDEGAARFSQGVMFDITERKEAENALREAEERYRVLVEHIPAVLYVDLPDEGMTTVYVSPQIEDVLGIRQQEFLGSTGIWSRRVHPEDLEDTIAAFRDGVRGGEPFAVEYRWTRPDGEEIWVRDEAALLHDERGRNRFVQGVMFDVTERKQTEQTLRESEQREREAAERLRTLDEMKNTFLAAVSHELRSPLTSILGLALTLERQDTMSFEDQSDLLGRLAANARKLDRLLKDLLDIDRLNRGIVTPNYRLTDIGLLARRTAESLDVLGGRNLIVETDPVIIPVDPAKVERIVENLLANAVRHTGPEASIWLRVAPSESGALLAIEDDGPGVPKDLQEVIFEPFRQGPTASPHAPGTGIGLSLVAMFADLHGGRAWVEDRDGGGASFRVFLPGTQRSRDEDAEREGAGRLVG